jgi:hypothetical protein
MNEKLSQGLSPEDWTKINSAPLDRTSFRVDLNASHTRNELIGQLKDAYKGNPVAQAQLALWDSNDPIGALRSQTIIEARQLHVERALTLRQEIQTALLERFPQLKELNEVSILNLIDMGIL